MDRRTRFVLLFTVLFALFLSAKVEAQEYVPDSTLSDKIFICKPETTICLLGDISLRINRESAIPYITIGNGEDLAELSFFPGDVANSICRIKIFKSDIIKPDIWVPWQFFSESGLRIGLCLNDVLLKKGPPEELSHCGKTVTLVYRLDSKSSFLKRYNMPLYSQVFIFEDDYLSIIEYGFDYP